ncbi:MAG: hydroxyacid dehydrogenase [Deltaproteobacteria bacterium HGW-Deltaproteobacteria-12]|jgi:glycerate dehydrogenase|nr:MAG: hydroxyacid dehydrogenase [Deltaproteobacteria bacterium HGW-Deltaproteobacteria-12]
MKKPVKIVFLDAVTLGVVDNLAAIKSLGDYTGYDYTLMSERIERISGHNIVLTNKVVIDREVMDACPEIELICVVATGTNIIDLEYAAQKGITVKNVAGYSTESVTQSTFSMLFYLMHSSAYYNDYVKSGDYAQSPIFTNLNREFRELNNKLFGIIGMGNIGKRVAQVAEAFGARVAYYSTSGKNLTGTGHPHLPLDELLSKSDVVSIHCPLNSDTKNLLNAERIRRMKPSAYLLNMGRGGIVDEHALARAIDENSIAGAALDVLSSEPIAGDNPLLSVRNKDRLFITPHIAWASSEARQLLTERTLENIRSHLEK